jgi:acyl carrier protein
MNTREAARNMFGTMLGCEPEDIDESAPLFELVASSFRIVEMVIELQEAFDVRFRQDDMNRIATVGDLLDLVQRRHERRTEE